MPTINYTFEPNQDVFIIKEYSNGVLSVRAAKILRFKSEVLLTTTNSSYDVRINEETGTTEVSEDDVFATLTEAVDEYELRLA